MSGTVVCLKDLELEAQARLARIPREFYASGSDGEETLRGNREAWSRWYIIPRMLRDVSERDLSTSVLGQKVSMPIGVAPTGLQKMAHPDGECASVRATSRMGTVFTASTLATTSMEDTALAAPNGILWFQLYVYKDRDVTRGLVKRAECAGFKALVLTVDVPLCGNRRRDRRNKFTLPSHLSAANFQGAKGSRLDTSETGSGNADYAKTWFDQSLTWKDIEWLKSITSLPIVIKGILCYKDVNLCLNHGASAVWLSNHGGRQLNGVPPTIEALPEVVAAAAGRCEVYVDGGVTQGTDVLKALALGAQMVFIGRPIIWGLSYDGEEGVKMALSMLKQELDLTMALSGCRNVREISPALLRRKETYSRL